ncbi:MAG: amylo-alpha-1,6-glucosidase [Lachnospiraceae bacterium]|nr:amylo-alpha-1,6-glucosidase [Lachnospiraceae bacterium]
MKFKFDKTDFSPLTRGESDCFLLTDGLGGYCSLTHAGSVARGDQALLMTSRKAPGDRWHMLTNVNEILMINGQSFMLSSQRYDFGRNDSDHTSCLSSFEFDGYPTWTYCIKGVMMKKSIAMAHGHNTVAISYDVYAPAGTDVSLKVVPLYRITPKNEPFKDFSDTSCVKISTEGCIKEKPAMKTPSLYFSQDERDGRIPAGKCFTDKIITFENTGSSHEIVFSTEEFSEQNPSTFKDVLASQTAHQNEIVSKAGFSGEISRELLRASDAFIVKRENVNGKTVIAGYPFFEDWGRDTFISLPGLTLAANRFEDCKLILRTFARYEHNGLFPNLFPEGGEEARYNSADAPLLFINMVWRYAVASNDEAFLEEMLPAMLSVEHAFENGTDFHIKMDDDGLINAGADKEQLTWMDVCVNGFLPTPRHGKPVEINAYWYSALKILYEITGDKHFETLAAKVKASFLKKFYNKEKNCLKDVLNGTPEEDQIRCNQIWALTQPFTMLDEDQAEGVLSIVKNELFTTAGLRTLSPKDPDFHEVYIGDMLQRDTAYHQGTVWVFPLGAYYIAEIRHIITMPEGAAREDRLKELEKNMSEVGHWLSEGCTGQLPEIYDGLEPTVSRGCFAQAWSVGEILNAFNTFEEVFKKGL